MRTKQKTPKWGIAGEHKRRFIDATIKRATSDPRYHAAYARAEHSFDDFVAQPTSETLEALHVAVAEVAGVATTMNVPLEITFPVAGGLPMFARWLLDEIARDYIEGVVPEIAAAGDLELAESSRDNAQRFREALASMPLQAGFPPQPLSRLGAARGRGQPPGPAGPLKDLDIEQTETRILRELAQLTRAKRGLTIARVAERLGMGERALQLAMTHHGLKWAALKAQAKKEAAARRPRPGRPDLLRVGVARQFAEDPHLLRLERLRLNKLRHLN